MNSNQNINFDLVLPNLELARKLANKYSRYGINSDDLYSEAIIGLIKASQYFDPKYKNFEKTATIYIKSQIIQFYAKNKFQISLPINKFREFLKFRKENSDISQDSIFSSYFYNKFESKDDEENLLEVKEVKNDESLYLKTKKQRILDISINLSNEEKLIIFNLLGINCQVISGEEIRSKYKIGQTKYLMLRSSAIVKLKKELLIDQNQNLSFEQLKEKFLKCQN